MSDGVKSKEMSVESDFLYTFTTADVINVLYIYDKPVLLLKYIVLSSQQQNLNMKMSKIKRSQNKI